MSWNEAEIENDPHDPDVIVQSPRQRIATQHNRGSRAGL